MYRYILRPLFRMMPLLFGSGQSVTASMPWHRAIRIGLGFTEEFRNLTKADLQARREALTGNLGN